MPVSKIPSRTFWSRGAIRVSNSGRCSSTCNNQPIMACHGQMVREQTGLPYRRSSACCVPVCLINKSIERHSSNICTPTPSPANANTKANSCSSASRQLVSLRSTLVCVKAHELRRRASIIGIDAKGYNILLFLWEDYCLLLYFGPKVDPRGAWIHY